MQNINRMFEVSQDIEKYTLKLAQNYCIMPPGEGCVLSNAFTTLKNRVTQKTST